MNKKIVYLISIIVVIGVGLLIASRLGAFDSEEVKEEKFKQEQIEKIKDTKFATLPTLTFDQLDKKIKDKENFVVYFGWVSECGDSRLFETNSVDKFLTDDVLKNNKIYVVNLDNEAPDALAKSDLRKPITKRFLIDTWTKDESLNPMSLKSPQLVHYDNGKIVNLVSWTAVNSDSKTGINEEYTKKFFDSLK